jgi:hypothetical protein
MPAIPDGYPFTLNDQDLDDALETMLGDLGSWPRFSTLLPELKLMIIAAGIQERTRRETEELRRVARDAADIARRTSTRALWISLAALAVALVTLVVAIVR